MQSWLRPKSRTVKFSECGCSSSAWINTIADSISPTSSKGLSLSFTSSKSLQQPFKVSTIIIPFCKWQNWGSKRWSHVPMVKECVSGRERIQIWLRSFAISLQSPACSRPKAASLRFQDPPEISISPPCNLCRSLEELDKHREKC